MRIKSRTLVALVVVAAAVLLVGVRVSSTVVPPAEATTGPSTTGFSAQIGPESRVFGPSIYVDMPFHTIKREGDSTVHGFLANNNSLEVSSGSAGVLTSSRTVLSRGPSGTFDQCGAWLMGSIYKDPTNLQHWVAFYHAERAEDGVHCLYAGGHTTWTMAITESFDAGKTWHKQSYKIGDRTVNQKVLTQDPALLGDPITDDAGNGRVIVHNGYFYMFFEASTEVRGSHRLNVARAPVSSFGRPGSWTKWYCDPTTGTCDFTEPGLGGKSTALANIPTTARSITWSTFLQRWIAVSSTGRYGFVLWQSADLLKWRAMDRRVLLPPVTTTADPTVDDWSDRDSKSKALYGYGSLLGLDLGPNATGPTFYLYYLKIFPGQSFDKRYLMRRQVRFVATTGTPTDRVALTLHYRKSDGLRRTSIELPPPALNLRPQASAGYLLATARTGYNPLFECAKAGGDHYLRQNSCSSGDTPVRRLGWISPGRTALATTALYNCFNSRLGNHFAMTSSTCAGKVRVSLLGYVAPSLS